MIKLLDSLLNRITMYRLMLYYLIGLLVIALGFSYFGSLAFHPFDLIISVAILLISALWANKALAAVFSVPANTESAYISALILALIVTPGSSFNQLVLLIIIAVLAMASKFLLVYKKHHLFNPVAIAAVLTAYLFSQGASWWVGNNYMVFFVLFGGLLIAYKVRRFKDIFLFIFATLVIIAANYLLHGANLAKIYQNLYLALTQSSLLFFAFVMFSEPLTSPTTEKRRLIYAVVTAFLYSTPQVQPFGVVLTPELALSFANLLSFIYFPQAKLFLALKDKVEIAKDTFAFLFSKPGNFSYAPGQYMEWTLPHQNPDNRGVRRYFSLASSPKADELAIAVKFNEHSSSFKKKLLDLKPGEKILASELSGDFVLPKNKKNKFAFIAGGIGIAPFQSMIQDLLDRGEKRDITLFYSNKTIDDIAFSHVFSRAAKVFGLKTVYTLTDKDTIPADWQGDTGFVDKEMIKKHLPDYLERTFYISGPNAMVLAVSDVLRSLGVTKRQIITDFFPGY